MRTLKISHECEEERLRKMKLEIKFMEELHQEKLKMIRLQAKSPQKCVFIQQVDNENE
jgi:hypothetical protein